MRLLWAAVVLSFAFWLLVLGLGFADPVAGAEGRYRTYFDEANWWLFPLFFLGRAPALYLSWSPRLRAWARLAKTGVLRGAAQASGDQPEGRPGAATVARVVEEIRRPRGIVIALAPIEFQAKPWSPPGRMRTPRDLSSFMLATPMSSSRFMPRLVAISNAQQEAFAPKTVRDLLKENSAAPWGAYCCPSGP